LQKGTCSVPIDVTPEDFGASLDFLRKTTQKENPD
jgi:hypothetical protein